MTKIVINKCYGGYGLSLEAIRAIAKRKGITLYERHESYSALIGPSFYIVPPEEHDKVYEKDKVKGNYTLSNRLTFSYHDIPRDDKDLVAVVKKLGVAANGNYAALKIVSIPDGVEWRISEYDGIETIEEEHRSWG